MIRTTIPFEHAKHNHEIKTAVLAMRELKLRRKLSPVAVAALKYLEGLYARIYLDPEVTFTRKQTDSALKVARFAVARAGQGQKQHTMQSRN